MDNNQNQMNGMQPQNNVDSNAIQNTVATDNGMNQEMVQQVPVNNGMAPGMQQQAPVNNGMAPGIQQQVPVNNGVAPVMSQQQVPMNNGMAPMSQQIPVNGGQAPKSNNTLLIVIIVVLGVVILGLAGFIGVSLLNGNETTGAGSEIEDVETEEEVEEEVDDDINVGTIDNANTQKITHDGYTYTVDSNVVYQVQDGMLLVRNSASTVVIQMTSAYGSYAQYLASSESLKQQLINSGYGTITYQTQKYNNRDYMVFSGTYNNIPFQFFIVGLDDTHVIQGMMITKTGSEFTDGYNLMEDFVSDVNGTSTGDTSSSFSVQIPNSNNGTFFQPIQ